MLSQPLNPLERGVTNSSENEKEVECITSEILTNQPGLLQQFAVIYCQAFQAPPYNELITQAEAEEAILHLSEHILLASFQNNELAGGVGGYITSEDQKKIPQVEGVEFYLAELFVSPNIQKKGHGTRLMSEIINKVRKRADYITLRTSANPLNPATQIYRNLGFVDTGKRELVETLKNTNEKELDERAYFTKKLS